METACAQCKHSLRDENHGFDDSNQIWPAHKDEMDLEDPYGYTGFIVPDDTKESKQR